MTSAILQVPYKGNVGLVNLIDQTRLKFSFDTPENTMDNVIKFYNLLCNFTKVKVARSVIAGRLSSKIYA